MPSRIWNCKAAIEAFPVAIPITNPNGIWYGSDDKPPMPPRRHFAIRTVILARKYLQPNSPFATDDSAVKLYIINCHDATDLLGYYPPVCYPCAQSMQLIQQQPRSAIGRPDHRRHGISFRRFSSRRWEMRWSSTISS